MSQRGTFRAKPPAARQLSTAAEVGRWVAAAASAYQAGQLPAAEQLCRQILGADPRQYDALEMLGILTARSSRLAEAARLLQRGIAARPDSAEAHFNYANILQMLGRHAAALDSYDRAIELQPALGEAHCNRSQILQAQGHAAEALEGFQRALVSAPGLAEAWQGAAILLRDLRRLDDALAHCEQALTLNPRYAEAHNTRGIILQDLERLGEAVAAFRAALTLRPDYAEAQRNLGAAWQAQDRHEAAVECVAKALALDPHYPWLAGTLAFARLQLCDWRDFATDAARVTAGMARGQRIAQPFAALALTDSPRLQRRAAETWARDTPGGRPVMATAGAARIPPAPCDRIRLGYYSADFHNHATAYLTAELFERHDRERFELFAFSFGPATGDAMRTRIAAAFGEFIDVRTCSDQEIAQLSQTRGIDIAVDLKGFTNLARSGIFAARAAPLQVNYLGYPGTMGAKYIDYLIADQQLIAPGSRADYTESIAFLPDSYQVNDRHRQIAQTVHPRTSLGLPAAGFVFCCFNNTFKITPDVFDGWMRILQHTPGSVLWLLADNDGATRNLRREARARGVAEERLVFAPRWPLAEHLARLRAADLCLDTLPYNAHTTASDALWAGVPLLTRAGESFAGRVAASLLTAVGLPELITRSAAQYESAAIDLARQPQVLSALRGRLAANRLVAPLFDTVAFTRHLESAYSAMHARRLAGLPPQDFTVAPLQASPRA